MLVHQYLREATKKDLTIKDCQEARQIMFANSKFLELQICWWALFSFETVVCACVWGHECVVNLVGEFLVGCYK